MESVKGLLSGIKPSPGQHDFTLVIDPNDQINETNETDNVVVRTINFGSPDEAPEIASEFLPNLTLIPDPGKSEVLFVASHRTDPLSGKLSVDHPSYAALAVLNQSVQYITQNVEVDLYIDDLLARRAINQGLEAGGRLPVRIEDLHELVNISPGPHTLRVVVDPLDRIQESDEADNEYEVELVWGTGDPPPADEPFTLEPPEREPQTLANLMPFREFGWSAAISAQQDDGPLPIGQDGWLDASKAVRIDFGFTNASRFSLPLTNQLAADVLIDGQFIRRLKFASGGSNVGTVWKDHVVLDGGALAPGEHTARIVLDPDNLFSELDEADNIFERTFTWNIGPDPASGEAFEMSDEEIAAAFAPLYDELRSELRPVRGPGSVERDWTPEIVAAGRVAYYLLTGRDVNEEGYALHFLAPGDFRNSSTATCMTDWVTMSNNEYAERFEFCTEDRGEIGFKTRANGQIHLFVDLGLSPLDALGTYLHELGHGLQDLTNPGQTELEPTLNTRGLNEGQAQIFEAAGWRAIEEFMGESLSMFPDVAPARDSMDFIFDVRRDRGTVHDIGYRLLWTQALTNPETADELRTSGILSSQSAYELFRFLTNMPADEVSAWAEELLNETQLMDEFQSIAEDRLVPDLSPELTGHTALRDATWTAP